MVEDAPRVRIINSPCRSRRGDPTDECAELCCRSMCYLWSRRRPFEWVTSARRCPSAQRPPRPLSANSIRSKSISTNHESPVLCTLSPCGASDRSGSRVSDDERLVAVMDHHNCAAPTIFGSTRVPRTAFWPPILPSASRVIFVNHRVVAIANDPH